MTPATTRPDASHSTTPAGGTTLRPGQRAALEAERDFLLASLRDLDAEHVAGELDDAQHETLTSRYSARAARVLRALETAAQATEAVSDAAESTPEAPAGRRWRRRAAVLVPLVGALVAALVLLPSALSDRQAGQTITGNAQSAGDPRVDLERAVAASPDDPTAHRGLARVLLDDGDLVGALQHYDEAARLDPRDAESRAYAGWIVGLANLHDDALGRIDAAIAVDPTYPDAHFFRGMVLLRGTNDRVGAAAELRRFLELAPDTPLRPQVEQVLAGLDQPPQAEPTTTSPGGG
ncbi:MAG: tetratricopeptide repeat protein [Acidimicrobiales bacterium]